MSPEYAAGLFDGEGTVVITKPNPSAPRRHRLKIQLQMSHEETVRSLHALFGLGHMQEIDAARWWPGAKRGYRWVVTGPSAVEALTIMRPHLITKAHAADLALEFYATTSQRGVKLTDAQLLEREDMREQLVAINAS